MEFNSGEFIEDAKLLVREVESFTSMEKYTKETNTKDIPEGIFYEMQDTYQTILRVRSSLLKMLDDI